MASKEIERNTINQKGSIDHARRRTVLGAAGGAVAVAVWHKPVINAVALPAHAQTSPGTMTLTFFASGAVATPLITKASPLDWLIPEANAGLIARPVAESEFSASIAQTAPDSQDYQVDLFERRTELQEGAGEFLYSGIVNETTGGTLSVTANPCELKTQDISVEIGSISDTSITLNLITTELSLEVPAGSGSLPTPVCNLPELPDNFFDSAASPLLELMSQSTDRSLLDILVPAANAGDMPQDNTFGFSASKETPTSYGVRMVNARGNVLRTGVLTIGSQGALVFEAGESCGSNEGSPRDIPTTINFVDQLEMGITIVPDEGPNLTFRIPVGAGVVTTNCGD